MSSIDQMNQMSNVANVADVAPVANMSSLPAELASLISSSIKHDPIYLLTYVTIGSVISDEDGDPKLETSTSECSKLVVLEGTRNEARKHVSHSAETSLDGGKYGPLHNIWSKYSLPAYLKAHRYLTTSAGNTPPPPWNIVSTVDYFNPGRTIRACTGGLDHTTYVIVSLKRFA